MRAATKKSLTAPHMKHELIYAMRLSLSLCLLSPRVLALGLTLVFLHGNASLFVRQGAAQDLDKTAVDADPLGWMVPQQSQLEKTEQKKLFAGGEQAVQIEPGTGAPSNSQSIDLKESETLQTSSTTDENLMLPENLHRSPIGLGNEETGQKTEQRPVPSQEKSSPALDSSLPCPPVSDYLIDSTELLTAPSGIQNSLKFALILGALSLAPAIILMTTCYIRVVVVLSLLKQAFGGQQLPPAQIMTALSLFMTFLIMTPVWNDLKTNAIDPYTKKEVSWEEAWSRGTTPIKNFMVRQIELAGNAESVAIFYKYADVGSSVPPADLSEVPLNVLIPAYMISELKVAFLLGFQIFLPFLVVDLIVSSVTVSMGMLMLPPQMVSFPLKLILFVLVDGWNLVIGMLLQSFGNILPMAT
jgi:flagellar biosynthesis protein FliP